MIKKKIKDNVLVINFKTYLEATAKKAEKIAKIADAVSKETNKNIVLAVQETDIYRLSKLVDIPVFSEHLDPIDYGAHTGKVLAKSLKFNGASGVLLNHSEDRFDLHEIELSVKLAKKHKLKTIVCANDAFQSGAISLFKPDFIAVEPPELIGGKVSVSSAKPEIITKTIKKVNSIKKVPVLCGAGIKTGQDVKKAIELGASGVLVASGVVKAKNIRKKIKELVEFL
jgi:triosephosphate isomerase